MTAVSGLLVLLLTPLVPFVLALVLLFKRNSRVLQTAAALAASVGLVTSILMPPGIASTLPWLLEGSEFGLDVTGRLFLFFTSAVWLAAGVYARQSIEAAGRDRFYVFFLLVMSGNLGLIVARDMLSFYLLFVLMSFAAYGLIVHDGGAASRRAGRIYMVLLVGGDMILYAALALAALDTGGDVLFGNVLEAMRASSYRDAIIALVILGFGVKVGIFGLHVALPLIYRAAPSPAAAVLAGAMINAGLLGWLRYLPLGSEETGWGRALMGAGAIAAFYGVLVGVTQRNAASVLAYSSMSQMGIVTAGVGAALMTPEYYGEIVAAVIVYAMHHAFAKSALFLGLGVANAVAATGRRRVLVRAGLLLPALALTGAPLTSGMLAKEFLKETLGAVPLAVSAAFAALLPWTAFATTLIVARFLWLVWPRRELPGPAVGRASAHPAMVVAWVAMLLLAATGVWFVPEHGIPSLWSAVVLWEVTWPVALGGLVAVVVAAAIRTGRLRPPSAVPPGDVLVAAAWITGRLLAAWARFAKLWLPAARDRLRTAVRSARKHPIWGNVVDEVEDILGEWSIAITLFVAMLVILGSVTIWR